MANWANMATIKAARCGCGFARHIFQEQGSLSIASVLTASSSLLYRFVFYALIFGIFE